MEGGTVVVVGSTRSEGSCSEGICRGSWSAVSRQPATRKRMARTTTRSRSGGEIMGRPAAARPRSGRLLPGGPRPIPARRGGGPARRPGPGPGRRRRREGAPSAGPRANRSKTRSRNWKGTPGPASSTSRRIVPSARRTCIPARPRPWTSAFSTRLATIRSSRRRSARMTVSAASRSPSPEPGRRRPRCDGRAPPA